MSTAGGKRRPVAPASTWLRLQLREAVAGVGTGLLMGAQALPQGMIGFAVLGPSGVALGMACALASSALAGFCSALLGSSRPLIATTSTATALVTASFLASLMPPGEPAGVLLAMLLAALSGVMLLLLGRLGLARLAALVPTPVTIGLGNAIVVLVFLSLAPIALGLAPGQQIGSAPLQPASIAVTAVALALMLRPLPAVPPPLAALGIAAALHHAMASFGAGVGPVVGIEPSPASIMAAVSAAAGAWPVTIPAGPLLLAATSLALLAALETLAAGNALREATGQRADQRRDLTANGAALIGSAFLGGMPNSAASAASVNCWRWGGRRRAALLWRAATTAAVLLVAGPLVALLPYAALSGVLAGAVVRLLQWRSVLPGAGPGRARRLADLLVVLAVVMVAVLKGLVAAVTAGVLLAVLIFTAAMSQSVIRRSLPNPVGRSRVRRPVAVERVLREAGERIRVIELEGAIFFGSAESVVLHAERARAAGAEWLILDLGRVTRIDVSGGRRLLEICKSMPGRLFLAPLRPGCRQASELEALGLLASVPEDARFADLAAAVEAAEDQLLRSLQEADLAAYPTAEEALAALGIPAAVVSALLARMQERRFADGELILRRDDPADAAFLLLEGEVLVSIRAAPDRPATRLAVFAPGVVFGEGALLGATQRNADAVARGAVRCLRLDARAAEALRAGHPEAAWQLMAAVARQLAGHVNAANATIDGLES